MAKKQKTQKVVEPLIEKDFEEVMVETPPVVKQPKKEIVAKTALTKEECEMIEQYIENSEPPIGHSLNAQYINNLYRTTKEFIDQECQQYNFDSLSEVTYAGREGSNHPHRNNARRAMEFADAVNSVLDQLVQEIQSTREDFLKEYDSYESELPSPYTPEDTRP